MRSLWTGFVGLALGCLTTAASAQQSAAPPAVGLGLPVALDAAPAATRVVRGQAPDLSRPAAPASLGAPIVATPDPRYSSINSQEAYNNGMVPVSATTTTASAPPPPPPPPSGGPPPPPPPPGTAAPLPPGLAAPGGGGGAGGGSLFGCDCLGSTCGSGRAWFQSDHGFDGFISPVSNPFLFEDPRSLTEARPLLIYNHIPNSNYALNGGDVWFYGTQLRLAVTDRLSFVMNKLGFITFDPHDPSGLFPSDTGFAELDFGPKFTFLRSECTGTVAAAGLTFQIPTGSSKAFQDTGSLSLVPYVSVAQNFGKLANGYGSFNFVGTTGYSFSVDNQRSDYYYLSTHLDFDVGDLHKIYPLIELNWFHYTSSGNATALGFEGRDLINFGSTNVNGENSLTIAFGARYKFNENIQTGVAFEFPLIRPRDIVDFRVTWDVILRY